jgi:3-oxoadipate enol-lactonase
MAKVRVGHLDIAFHEKGSGKTIVFLHGVGSDISVWKRQLDYFSKKWRAVAIEYTGYGESDLPAKGLSREELGHSLFGAMDGLGILEAHIVGLSMGGVMALEMVRQQPSRLRSLTLADTFARHPNAMTILEGLHRDISTMTMDEFAKGRVDLILAPDATEALKQEVIETMAKIDKRTYYWSTTAVWTADYRKDLPQIQHPTLIAIGEHDQLTPVALSEELAREISGSKLQVIPKAGHLSNLDNPDFFNRIVSEFILSVDMKLL